MLKRTSDNWLIAMLDFEVYFDDSGTHGQSEIAVGACYIAPKDQWDLFVKDLDLLRAKHGFDCFHMADFMAGQQDFVGWDDSKRERVLRAVSCLIKTVRLSVFLVRFPRRLGISTCQRSIRKLLARDITLSQ
jgi:hypothetical protein